MPRMTKTERISRQKMIRYLYEDHMGENDISLVLRDKVPQAWHTLEHNLDVEEPKVKVTLRLEEKYYEQMAQWNAKDREAAARGERGAGFGSGVE